MYMWFQCVCLNIHKLVCAHVCDLVCVGMGGASLCVLMHLLPCLHVRVRGCGRYVIRSTCGQIVERDLVSLHDFNVIMMDVKESTCVSLGTNFLAMENSARCNLKEEFLGRTSSRTARTRPRLLARGSVFRTP